MKTLINFINLFFLTLVLINLISCSSAPQITKWTSPDLRVAIDPQNIDSGNYVRIEEALLNSKKFFVVDRGAGFVASVKEQDHNWGTSYAGYSDNRQTFDRYGDSDRYARLGKLYGVGSVIVAHVRCGERKGWWSGVKTVCAQYLALINTSTAEVVAAVTGEADDAENYYGVVNIASSWDETVDKLIAQIPTEYQPSKYDERMKLYRKEIREESIRKRENETINAEPLSFDEQMKKFSADADAQIRNNLRSK